MKNIIHAGGKIDMCTYTNSYESIILTIETCINKCINPIYIYRTRCN